ncbi:hypothetical protein CC80DRAFT_498344 [Byssothecium circinans]|uniref:Uncharacterized protein n=1 Tax=Byssothecium circinans TaxID=147558 RepID=A0A6A5TH82_9PLEO|nr:hypothetical protein CC80DRAFT_498344 [Byssothecium circinans]
MPPRATSSTAAGVAASDVVLTGPRNWDEWYNVFKGRAISARVWKYLNPEDNNKPTLWKEKNKRYHINQQKQEREYKERQEALTSTTVMVPATVNVASEEITLQRKVTIPPDQLLIPDSCTLKYLVSEFINSAAVVSVRTLGRTWHTAFPTTFNGEGSPYDGNGSVPPNPHAWSKSRKRTNLKVDKDEDVSS